MRLHTQTLDYQDGNTLLEGFLAYDKDRASAMPAVIIAHPWQGRNQFVCDKAIELAKLGYIGFALDMYGKGILGKDAQENARLMQPLMDNRRGLQQRILAALKAVLAIKQVDAKRIAAMGYCFGGLCVLDLARSGVDMCGVVSFHGLLSQPKNIAVKNTKAKILILHGDNDPLAPVQQLTALQQEFAAAKADLQIHIFSNTQHAFTNPIANDSKAGLMYSASANQRSWSLMQLFLTEVFNHENH